MKTLRTGKTALGVLALGLVSGMLTGCGSDVSGTPIGGEIDIRNLEVGNYSTDPLDIRSTYSRSPSSNIYLAIGRLADAVVIGSDVDESFTHSLLGTSRLESALAKVVFPVLANNNSMFGYTATSSTHVLPETFRYDTSGNFSLVGGGVTNPDATSFNVTVVQFPDQQRAETAAVQAEAADFDVAPDINVRFTLDKQPNAKAHWRPGVPSMSATLAHQNYLVNVIVQQPKPELDGLKDLAQRVLAAQLSLLDQTPALSAREILRMDHDPNGMMRRTLHPSNFAEPGIDEVTRTPRGYLHYVDDQRVWKQLLSDSGVDLVSTAKKGALLLRARDPEAANTLWAGINQLNSNAVDAPAGVPDASCIENAKPKTNSYYSAWDSLDRYVCTLYYDRYVARVAAAQLNDVHQKAAAQYALLAKSQYL